MSLGDRDRPLGRLQVIAQGSPRLRISEPRLAMSEEGDIAVLWAQQRAAGTSRPSSSPTLLRAAIRPPGGRFGRPVTVSSGLAVRHTAMYGPDGELLVAYATQRRSHGRTLRRVVVRARHRGGAFGPAHVLGDFETGSSWARASRAPGAPSWRGARCALERGMIHASIRSGPRRRFSAPRELARGDLGSTIPVGMAPDGTATVAWTFGESGAVRVATAAPGRPFGVVTTLGSGWAPHVAVRRDGAVLLVWFATVAAASAAARPAQTLRVRAALREPRARDFGPPEDVAPAHGVGVTFARIEPRAAFEPRTGRPTVIWPATGITGQPPVLVAGTSVLMLATRAP